MIIHTFHTPSTYSIPAPPASTGNSCPFCFSSKFRPGKACPDCGTILPSSSSSRGIPSIKRRKTAPVLYLPETDGLMDRPVHIPDELEPYAMELGRLDVDHDDSDAADTLPTVTDIEDLPWN